MSWILKTLRSLKRYIGTICANMSINCLDCSLLKLFLTVHANLLMCLDFFCFIFISPDSLFRLTTKFRLQQNLVHGGRSVPVVFIVCTDSLKADLEISISQVLSVQMYKKVCLLFLSIICCTSVNGSSLEFRRICIFLLLQHYFIWKNQEMRSFQYRCINMYKHFHLTPHRIFAIMWACCFSPSRWYAH